MVVLTHDHARRALGDERDSVRDLTREFLLTGASPSDPALVDVLKKLNEPPASVELLESVTFGPTPWEKMESEDEHVRRGGRADLALLSSDPEEFLWGAREFCSVRPVPTNVRWDDGTVMRAAEAMLDGTARGDDWMLMIAFLSGWDGTDVSSEFTQERLRMWNFLTHNRDSVPLDTPNAENIKTMFKEEISTLLADPQHRDRLGFPPAAERGPGAKRRSLNVRRWRLNRGRRRSRGRVVRVRGSRRTPSRDGPSGDDPPGDPEPPRPKHGPGRRLHRRLASQPSTAHTYPSHSGPTGPRPGRCCCMSDGRRRLTEVETVAV